jgi:signal transduction histidine kinase
MTQAWLITMVLMAICVVMAYLYVQQRDRNRSLQLEIDEARTSKRHVNDFLASMLHHLRTPLNGVMGYAEYIYSSTREPMIQFTSKIILENSLQMLHLVNSLLDLSKIQEGSLDLSQSSFDISDMVESVRALHQLRADELKISLHLSLAPNLPSQMQADTYRVRQVLNHLMDNALNYNRPQGKVTLSVTPSSNKQWVVFSVQDTGKGIAPEMQEAIFKRQQKSDHPFLLRPNEGAGLGLVLSHHLVNLMGGKLDYSSKAGEGSMFFFTLPVQSEHKLAA